MEKKKMAVITASVTAALLGALGISYAVSDALLFSPIDSKGSSQVESVGKNSGTESEKQQETESKEEKEESKQDETESLDTSIQNVKTDSKPNSSQASGKPGTSGNTSLGGGTTGNTSSGSKPSGGGTSGGGNSGNNPSGGGSVPAPGIPEGAEIFTGSDWDSIYPRYTIPTGARVLSPNGITNNHGGKEYVYGNLNNETSIVLNPDKGADGAELNAAGNTALTSLYCPDTLYAFVSLGRGTSSFKGCTSLTQVRLPKRMKSLPDGLFEGCTALKTIVLPEQLKSLGKRVFADCTGLKEVYIPSSCTSIDKTAFAGCGDGLTWVVVKGSYAEKLAKKTGQDYRVLGNTQNGWYHGADGKVQYFENGKPVTGMRRIGDFYYQFNEKGIMQTGIVKANGIRVPTDEEGRIQIGYQKIDGKNYYIDSDITYHKGFLVGFPGTNIECYETYCDPKTGEIPNGWFEADGQTYYIEDTRLLRYERKIDGVYYFFDDYSGAVQKNKKVGYPPNWIGFTDEKGAMRDGWIQWEGKTYYCAVKKDADPNAINNSPKAVSGWQEIEGRVYYFREDFSMFTGWLNQGGQRYYFHPDTGHLLTGWQVIGGQRYYFNGKGAMQKSWLEYEGDTYYLHYEDGHMMTGWIRISGKWYYMDDNGKMMRNTTTPDGFFVDENGVCHEKV